MTGNRARTRRRAAGMLAALAWCLAIAPAAAAADQAHIDLGASGALGLVWNDTWSPGFGGAGIELSAGSSAGLFRWSAGVAAAAEPGAWRLSLPLRAGLGVGDDGPVAFELAAVLAPGMIALRPDPAFCLGAGLRARLLVRPTPGFALWAALEPRWDLSPGYAAAWGPSTGWGVGIQAGVRWEL